MKSLGLEVSMATEISCAVTGRSPFLQHGQEYMPYSCSESQAASPCGRKELSPFQAVELMMMSLCPVRIGDHSGYYKLVSLGT